MPQLDFSTYIGQIFWLVISFSVLYALVSMLVLPKIGQVVESRGQQISSDLSSAENDKNKSLELENKADKILSESAAKARSVISEAVTKAKTRNDSKRHELSQKLEERIRKAEIGIQKIKLDSEVVIEDVAKDTAQIIANKILRTG